MILNVLVRRIRNSERSTQSTATFARSLQLHPHLRVDEYLGVRRSVQWDRGSRQASSHVGPLKARRRRVPTIRTLRSPCASPSASVSRRLTRQTLVNNDLTVDPRDTPDRVECRVFISCPFYDIASDSWKQGVKKR